MSSAPRTLVLSDGGLASLVACVASREAAFAAVPSVTGTEQPPRPLVVPASLPIGSARARLQAIARQCETLDLEFLDSPSTPIAADDLSSERHTGDLVRAGYAAVRRECPNITWPVHFEHGEEIDLEAVSDAVDRALLMGRILTIDSPGFPVRIDVPYADLTDRQVADLVLDMDVPAQLCWWWHAQLADPSIPDSRAEFNHEHRRWTAALAAVGWTAAP